MRSQATTLAYQMLDIMRANSAGAAAGNYVTALGVAPERRRRPPATARPPAATRSWRNGTSGIGKRLATALPAGTGSIATSTTLPLTVTIKVQWDDSPDNVPHAVASGHRGADDDRSRYGAGMNRTRGFSLVELMVAITLALIVTSAVISVCLARAPRFQATSGSAALTDNGRFALNFLETAVRGREIWACGAPVRADS